MGLLCPNGKTMDDFSSTTIYFDGQFWCAFIQKRKNGKLYAGRYVFGSEPANPRILDWMLHQFLDVPLYETEEIQKIRVKDFVKKNSGIPKPLEKYKVAQKEFLEKKKAEKRKENRCKGKVRQRN